MPQLLSPAAWYKSGRIEAMGSEVRERTAALH